MDVRTRFSLAGHRALVTGSTRGIGHAIQKAFAECGATVVGHGREPSECSHENTDSHTCFSDLSVPGNGRKLAQNAVRFDGPIDILVLNASIQIRRPWLEIDTDAAIEQIQTNFLASLEILQELVPAMQAAKWGRILTIGSVQEVRPHPDMAVYAATKCAQTHLIRNLARQLAADGITANNLAPGVIITDRNSDALSNPDYAAQVRASIPTGEFGQPDDLVGAALFLCSEAGRYVTGQNVFIDGGMSN